MAGSVRLKDEIKDYSDIVAEALTEKYGIEKIVEIGNINSEIIENALTSGWGDFEDAIQYFCATFSLYTLLSKS